VGIEEAPHLSPTDPNPVIQFIFRLGLRLTGSKFRISKIRSGAAAKYG
jgi:hypothetical protein